MTVGSGLRPKKAKIEDVKNRLSLHKKKKEEKSGSAREYFEKLLVSPFEVY